MIPLDELKRIARLKGLSLGNAEKDYLIDMLMLSVSRNTKDELIFKGGTCMYKFYKLDRFSEDLDFTALKNIEIGELVDRIISDLSLFGIGAKMHSRKEPFNSVLIKLRCEGPLYSGKPMTYSSLGIDINMKSSVDMNPALMTYNSIYPEIPAFSILAMPEKEILAEKVRAILTREKARDVYDAWFLLKKGIELDFSLIEKKLAYYNMKFILGEFEKAVDNKSGVWESELRPFVTILPKFTEAKKLIIEHVRKPARK
jgi:hypothetical protein